MHLVAKKIVLTTDYVLVAEWPEGATVKLVAASDNAGVAYMRGDDDVTAVPIPKGIPFTLSSEAAKALYLKGTTSDVVVIIGHRHGSAD